MKCTRQRCHVAPTTRWMAAFSPSCASEITSLTPRRPRLVRRFRKSAQKVSASDGPMLQPDDLAPCLRCWRPQRLSRRPRRCVRPRAPSGRSHPATDRASRPRADVRGRPSRARRFPCTVSRPGSCEMPESPIACASSSTRRVDTPPIQASWMTATNAFSAVLRGSRNGGK